MKRAFFSRQWTACLIVARWYWVSPSGMMSFAVRSECTSSEVRHKSKQLTAKFMDCTASREYSSYIRNALKIPWQELSLLINQVVQEVAM